MTTHDDASPEEENAAFRRLRELKASFGSKPNKDEQATALIGACIFEGFDTRKRIVRALKSKGLELNQAHIVFMLARHEGTDPKHHLWTLGDDWRYRLLEQSPEAEVPACPAAGPPNATESSFTG